MFTITPRLSASDGLVLSSCKIGQNQDVRQTEAAAEIRLMSLDGKLISHGVSGFS